MSAVNTPSGFKSGGAQWLHTVKPLLRVVLWVVVLWTGVARLRVRPILGLTERMAFWARRPWLRLIASLRDAMAMMCERKGGMGRMGGVSGDAAHPT